jgi:ABC-type uncharacterized transport system permease subunit
MIHKGTHSAIRLAAVTTNVAFPQCIGLLVSADVTATVTMADGTAVANVPLKAGYNPLQCTKVVFGSGTVHALYN